MSLRAFLVDRIEHAGPLTFAEYMDVALYHPVLGYYGRAAQRSGRQGDFYTSVDAGPVFGELLAAQLSEMWRLLQDAPDEAPSGPSAQMALVEAGAGNGRLSRDVLDALVRTDPEFYSVLQLYLPERSSAARDAQRATLGPHAKKRAEPADELPDRLTGIVFANELLDALPAHVVVMTRAGLREMYVTVQRGRLVEEIGPLSNPAIQEYLQKVEATLEPGWRVEVSLAAVQWMRSTSRRLAKGFLILIDYGHEARELYSATHASGTLTTFRRHHALSGADRSEASPPWLVDPGERDLTVHVDFTSVRRAGEAEGMVTLAQVDQTYFLLGLGLADRLADTGDALADLKRRMALKALALPGGLGSSHKVLIMGKGVGCPRLRATAFGGRST